MEIPTARILDDGMMRIAYSQADPYRWYTGGMGVFPGLEVSGRFTELTNIESGLGAAYGNYKDKAFDLKYQILAESSRFPALAVGVHDFHGTRLFPAEYLVLSRQVYPFDFTLGLGSKRLKGPVSLPLTDDLGIWGGIEWAVNERLHLMAEYNPVEYEKDVGPAGRAVPEGAKSRINVGLRLKILPVMDLSVSWQRGDTLGLMCHLQFDLGQPISPKRPDPPQWGPVHRDEFEQKHAEQMVEKIQAAIEAAGFQGVVVYTDGADLVAEFENNRYLSNQKAAGRVLRILLFNSPADTKKLIAILKQRQMPLLKVSVKPDHLDKYLMGKISEDIFLELLQIENASTAEYEQQPNLIKTAQKQKIDYDFGIKPDFQTYLNDPSGVFKFRLGIQPHASFSPWKGGEVYARYDIPFYSNISSSNEAPPDSVRADSWKYSDRDYTVDKLVFDQALRLSKKTFGRFSAGYFEKMYAGVSGEVLTFLGDGNLALGIESDWVRKREPDTQVALLDVERHTVLGNMFFYMPGAEITLQAQYGRFLGGDVGWRFIAGRKYNSGIVLGAWYSFTDTDDFKESYNRGYHDKGVFLSLPASMFLNYETSVRYNYSISPWHPGCGSDHCSPAESVRYGSRTDAGHFQVGYRQDETIKHYFINLHNFS